MTAAPENRLTGLDALRGLAAISVVVYHYTNDYAFRVYPWLTGGRFLPVSFTFTHGHYGVDLFFILSGFVIFMTLDRSPRCYDFLGSRVARLWPAYLFCLFMTAVVVNAWNLAWAPNVSLSLLIAHLTMMPTLFKIPLIDGSYWTLQYELMFYVLAATSHFLLGARRTELMAFLWLCLKVCTQFLPTGVVRWWIENLLAAQYAPLFIIGVMLYRIRTHRGNPISYIVLLLSLALCSRGPFELIPTLSYTAMICVFTLLVWLGTKDRSPIAFLVPLVFLGTVSYPLYLIHQTIGFGVIGKLMKVGFGPNQSILVTILLAILMAYAIHISIEIPARRAIRAGFARWRKRILGETSSTLPLAPDPGIPGPGRE